MPSSNQLSRRELLGKTLRTAGWGLAVSHLAAGSATAATKYGRVAGWQIACYTRPWASYDYNVAFDAVAEAGFKYIGFTGIKSKTRRVIAPATSLEESQKMGLEAKKRGLEIPNVYGGRLSSDKSVEAGIDSLRRLIDNCAAAGAWSAMVSSLGNEKTYHQHIKAIAECCDYAAEKGVAIVLKPHGGLTATGELLRKAVKRVGHESFTVMYDPGNIYYYSNGQIDPVKEAAVLDGLVTGMSIKDYKHPKNVALTPGTGQVDFPALMARLGKGGFTHGPLIVETLLPGDLDHLLGEAKKARRFVEKLVAGR